MMKEYNHLRKRGRHDRNLFYKVVRYIEYRARALEYFCAALVVQNHVPLVILTEHGKIIVYIVHVQRVFKPVIRPHGVWQKFSHFVAQLYVVFGKAPLLLKVRKRQRISLFARR